MRFAQSIDLPAFRRLQPFGLGDVRPYFAFHL